MKEDDDETPMDTELKKELGSAEVYERLSAEYEDLSTKFNTKLGDYSKQFAKTYTARLTELSKVLAEKARAKWG